MIKYLFKKISLFFCSLCIFFLCVFLLIHFAPDKDFSLRRQTVAVLYIIAESLPTSLALGFFSLIIALLLGMCLGIVAALQENNWLDYGICAVIFLGVSLPLFVAAPLLLLVFSLMLRTLPSSQWQPQGANAMIIPIISLSFPYIATVARLMRGSMINVMRSSYIRTAKAKGLSNTVIIFRHALPPAFLAVLGYMGPALASLVTGTLVVEQIFHMPGLSRPLMQSAADGDYTLIMGCLVTYALVLMTVNIVIDLLYAVLDPRIVYS